MVKRTPAVSVFGTIICPKTTIRWSEAPYNQFHPSFITITSSMMAHMILRGYKISRASPNSQQISLILMGEKWKPRISCDICRFLQVQFSPLPHFHRSIPRPQKPRSPVLRRSATRRFTPEFTPEHWSDPNEHQSHPRPRKVALIQWCTSDPRFLKAWVFAFCYSLWLLGHLRNLWWSPEMGLFFRKLYDSPCVFLGIFVTSANLAPGSYIKNISLSITFTWIQW